MPTYRFQVVVEQDEDGMYVAECPAFDGCYTQGATVEEAVTNIEEVIRMCLREMSEEGRPLNVRFPEVIGIKTVEVAL